MKNMNAKDLFGLAVRIMGLIFLYYGLAAFPTVINACMAKSVMGVIMVLWPLFVAYGVFRYSAQIEAMAYPDSEDDSEE
jgi:hypothetical protein